MNMTYIVRFWSLNWCSDNTIQSKIVHIQQLYYAEESMFEGKMEKLGEIKDVHTLQF
jgi:hypothetical protein